MRYGRTCEKGFLPVYSVDTEEEAHDLLVLACETNLAGEFIAKELVMEQTLDNLTAFGERLAEVHQIMMRPRNPSTFDEGVAEALGAPR